MKKIIIFIVTVLAANAQAQLKVNNDGNVSIQRTTDFPNVILGVGPQYGNIFNSMSVGIHSYMPNRKALNIGVMGSAEESASQSTGRACGIYGVASNFTTGYNYGVLGVLNGNNNGAAVFGTSNSTYSWGYNTGGRYAGFFYGDVYVTNTITAQAWVSLSDMRLKENVERIGDNGSRGSTLNNILNMNVISYNYKQKPTKETVGKEDAPVEVIEGLEDKRHYGLSAQEVQEIYPDLVYEGQDGYLGINYVELVPILIQSVKELKQELDELKEGNQAMRELETRRAGSIAGRTSILYQNSPNPFKEATTIRFSLAPDAMDAAICIFDMQGKMLQKRSVSVNETSLSLNGYELGAGMYLYTLIVNGQEVDTKRMIITTN